MSRAHTVDDPNLRRTGRTSRMLESIVDDGRPVWVVLPTLAFRSYAIVVLMALARHHIAQHIIWLSVEGAAAGYLRGVPQDRIYWDHEAERLYWNRYAQCTSYRGLSAW